MHQFNNALFLSDVSREPTIRAMPMNACHPLRILCVDDNHDVADSSADLFDLLGYASLACYSGASALRLVHSFSPDVCLIDLNMPGMDGDELAILLRKTSRPLLLVAVTAMSDAASGLRITEAGFDYHVIKPFDPSRLPDLVSAHFQQSA